MLVSHEGQSGHVAARDLLGDTSRPVASRDAPEASPQLSTGPSQLAPLRYRDNELSGLGGWLTLYAMGYPFSLLLSFVSVRVLYGVDWGTDSGVMNGLAIISLVNLGVIGYLAWLFYTKDERWPDRSVSLTLFPVVFSLLIAPSFGEMALEAVLNIAAYAVHVPYVRSSVRVANTFGRPTGDSSRARDDAWYVQEDGGERGLFSSASMVALYERGIIGPDTMVRSESAPDWHPASISDVLRLK